MSAMLIGLCWVEMDGKQGGMEEKGVYDSLLLKIGKYSLNRVCQVR